MTILRHQRSMELPTPLPIFGGPGVLSCFDIIIHFVNSLIVKHFSFHYNFSNLTAAVESFSRSLLVFVLLWCPRPVIFVLVLFGLFRCEVNYGGSVGRSPEVDERQ